MSSKHPKSEFLARWLIGVALIALVSAPRVAAQEPAVRLIELTALADEMAFDILQNRQQIVDQCRASQWCGVYGLEVVDAVEKAPKDLQLGGIAIPRVREIFEYLDVGALEVLVSFYRSPLGTKIVELETVSRTPAFLERVRTGGEEIYLRQSDERIALLESVDSISDARAAQRQLDGLARRVVEWVDQQAEARGKTPVQPAEPRMDRSRHAYFQWLAATFEPLTDEELESYVEFLESKGGENWSNLRREVRSAAVREAVQPIMEGVVARLRP